MGANWNSRQWAIEISLDSSNYCKLAHLLSFLGIKEQSAVGLNDEIRLLLDLCVYFEQLRPWPFN